MRKLKDFTTVKYLYGLAEYNRFNYSCAYVNGWDGFIRTGVSILLQPSTQKKVPKTRSTLKGYSLKYRRVNIDKQITAHLEFVISGEGASKSSFQRMETKRGRHPGVSCSNFISVGVAEMFKLAKTCKEGTERYWGAPAKPKATKKELINIRKELAADWKDKVVGIILNQENHKQLEYIRTNLGIFKKKPFFVQEFNNLVHPEATNYLTLQLYRY